MNRSLFVLVVAVFALQLVGSAFNPIAPIAFPAMLALFAFAYALRKAWDLSLRELAAEGPISDLINFFQIVDDDETKGLLSAMGRWLVVAGVAGGCAFAWAKLPHSDYVTAAFALLAIALFYDAIRQKGDPRLIAGTVLALAIVASAVVWFLYRTGSIGP